jgi:hypothetical protein
MKSQEQPNIEKNEKIFNIDLLNGLPQELQERLKSNWNIPEGMDEERINSNIENQISLLVQYIQEKLEDEDPNIRAEGGRVLSFLRQEFEDPKDFSDESVMQHLKSKTEGIWLEGGGKEANEAYKELYSEKKEEKSIEESGKYSELAEQANKKIEDLKGRSIEAQFNIKDLISNNALQIESFCNQQSDEISSLVDNLESLDSIRKGPADGLRLISRMLKRITDSPDYKKLMEVCQNKSLLDTITLEKIDKNSLDSFSKAEDAQKYIDDVVQKNYDQIEQLENARDNLIKQVKKVFTAMAKIGSSLNEALKNANESEQKNIEPFTDKFDQALANMFQIRKIQLLKKQIIDYKLVEPMGVEEIDDPDLNETIAEVDREGYRFNPKYSHNKEEGDVIVKPLVTAYKYKK